MDTKDPVRITITIETGGAASAITGEKQKDPSSDPECQGDPDKNLANCVKNTCSGKPRDEKSACYYQCSKTFWHCTLGDPFRKSLSQHFRSTGKPEEVELFISAMQESLRDTLRSFMGDYEQ